MRRAGQSGTGFRGACASRLRTTDMVSSQVSIVNLLHMAWPPVLFTLALRHVSLRPRWQAAVKPRLFGLPAAFSPKTIARLRGFDIMDSL